MIKVFALYFVYVIFTLIRIDSSTNKTYCFTVDMYDKSHVTCHCLLFLLAIS